MSQGEMCLHNTARPDVLYLYAVTADSLVTGPGEEAHRHVRGGRHQQTVDFVRVTLKHCLALPGLDTQKQNAYLIISNITYFMHHNSQLLNRF